MDFFVGEWKPKLLFLHMMNFGILGFQLLRHTFDIFDFFFFFIIVFY